jgi:hypothetical protein
MAQDYGAAQPIVDVAKNAYSKVSRLLGDPSEPAPSMKKVDTSWHDEMVKQANESARKQAESKTTSKRVSTQKPTASKQAPAKSTARKKLALKNY